MRSSAARSCARVPHAAGASRWPWLVAAAHPCATSGQYSFDQAPPCRTANGPAGLGQQALQFGFDVLAQSVNLETAVGQARVGCQGVRWRGATTPSRLLAAPSGLWRFHPRGEPRRGPHRQGSWAPPAAGARSTAVSRVTLRWAQRGGPDRACTVFALTGLSAAAASEYAPSAAGRRSCCP